VKNLPSDDGKKPGEKACFSSGTGADGKEGVGWGKRV